MKSKILIPVLFFLLFTGCKKENLETIVSAEDNSLVESEFAATFDLADDAGSTDGKLKKKGSTILPSGVVLKFVDSLFTDGNGIEYTLDFGPLKTNPPLGLLCKDGRYRAGIVRIKQSKLYAVIGAQLIISATEGEGYHSGDGTNMTQIWGEKTITRTAENKLSIQVTNGHAKINGNTMKWISTREITRIFDAGPGIWGDILTVTGNGSGTNRNGEEYTVNIDKELKKKMELGCARTFVSGVISLTNKSSKKVLVLDFDPYKNEACDRTAEVKFPNGTKKTFTVR